MLQLQAEVPTEWLSWETQMLNTRNMVADGHLVHPGGHNYVT